MTLVGSELAGMVLHGIGGVGKTTLAAELARRVAERQATLVLATVRCPTTPEALLAEVTTAGPCRDPR